MNKLLVTPSEVNEKAKEVTNLKEHMMSHLESIKTKIQNMTASNWVGTAGEAYMNQFIHVYNQSIAALDTLQPTIWRRPQAVIPNLKTRRSRRPRIWTQRRFSPNKADCAGCLRRPAHLPEGMQ